MDGDGRFSAGIWPILQITMGPEDPSPLRHIQQLLSVGNVVPPSGNKGCKYGLYDRVGMEMPVHCVNGPIHHSVRLPQFHRIHEQFSITPLETPSTDLEFRLIWGILGCRGNHRYP
jgi:hypothetical protein